MTWKTCLQIAGAAAVASALASALFWPGSKGPHEMTATARWEAMTAERKRSLMDTYTSFQTPEAFAAVLSALRQFERYDAQQREQLAQLEREIEALTQHLTPRQRAQLDALPPAAQAVQLFHYMEEMNPQALDELAQRFRSLSEP